MMGTQCGEIFCQRKQLTMRKFCMFLMMFLGFRIELLLVAVQPLRPASQHPFQDQHGKKTEG